MNMNQSAALVPRILQFRQNDFDLKFIRNDTEIVIEAENSKTSRFYSKILSDAEIEQYDNMFYNDVLNFHKILNEGFEGRHDHVAATIDDQALITLTSKFKVAGRDRQSSIPIQLVEKQLDPMKECERLLTKLDKDRSDEWGVTENQFFNLFKRIFQNQQVLTGRMEEIGHNGMNRSVPLKDKKYDGIETLEQRLKRTEEQIEEINEVVLDNIVPLEKNIEQIQTEVREKIEKLEKSLEKVIQENVELEKRLKKLESDDPQSSQSLQANELKQHIDTIENRFNKFEELNNVIMADTQVKVEELRKKLTEFEANHKDLSRRVERAVESPERQTKGEPSIASAEFDAVKESVESLAKRVREISQSVEFQEALQKERYIEFQKVSADTEKKLVMIKEIYVSAENRLKGLEEEARKAADHFNNRPAPVPVPEEIKNEVEPKKESIILKNEEPVFRKDRSKPGLAIQAEFKPNFFDGDLKFTNNNQVVESPLGITIDRTLFGRNPLPKKGKYCLSVKYGNVVRGANGVFAIGVAVYNKEIDIVTPGCFFITPFEKVAYINGMDINYHSADLQKDDLICIIIDRQENLIAFEISGKVVIEDRLNPDFFDDQDLYPCIHIQQCSDLKLSFISEY